MWVFVAIESIGAMGKTVTELSVSNGEAFRATRDVHNGLS